MGFIDVDEFLVIKDRSVTDLPTLLKRFEGKGGVAVNWRLFGSSGRLKKPAGTLSFPCHTLSAAPVSRNIANVYSFSAKDSAFVHSAARAQQLPMP